MPDGTMVPSMKTVAILNGPNLHRLGKREPEIYGRQTLDEIVAAVRQKAAGNHVEVDHFQSNHEGDLIEKIHVWSDASITLGMINPAGLTHTSVALRDAIAASGIRFVEVHLSHIHKREPFRHTSLTAPACVAQISGMGAFGYLAALDYLLQLGS
jgi:3-dehydroquinate dehydratase-2